ncbi:MAG: hypothetical protein COB98_04235 [Flavobacteriaceae bacterium]|nr:MAG: hypothetical protein COB98_04235 [Flavobacteriaceae bacterium]
MNKNQFTLFIYILFISYNVLGQVISKESTTLKKTEKTIFTDKVITFENDNKSEEVIINIKEQTPTLELKIKGTISYGELKVKVIDPKGKVRKKFSIKAKGPNKNETTIGEINKILKKPASGKWIIKISIIKGTGTIEINANFGNYYINAPNSFTPNGDGENDIFNLDTSNISEIIYFKIFDRKGDLSFSSTSIHKGWDGKVKNELQSSGTYFYTVEARTISGKKVTKTGWVYLIN